MKNTIIPGLSESFVDVAKNRNSLEPRPSRMPDDSCVHRRVTDTGDNNEFSGQRGHPVFPIRLPSASLSLSIGELAANAITSNHRHAYESLIYIIEGCGYTVMQGQRYEWQAGDAIYVPPWCWHQHGASAEGPAQYITATNMPLLDNLGQTVLRQEE
ncbi:MAG: cupin domain-containing protein [Proteobacteria bacterium]|nr:cupin domain-containing protein [Pseudomonadota bacterium]